MTRLAGILPALLLSAAPLAAQEVAVHGVVRDAATAESIPYAIVEIVGAARRFSADAAGR